MDDLAVQAARLRARFEKSRLPQVECDGDGRLRLVNDALCALVARSREDLVGRPVDTITHEADRGAADRRLADLLAGGAEAEQYERLLQAPDGAPLPVLVDVTLLRDAEGRPDGAASSYQDLRALRQAERQRHRQAELHHAFEQLSHELALVVDQEGALLYVSPGVSSLLGYSVDEVVNREGWAFVHPDDEDRVRREFALVLSEPGPRSWLVRLRNAAGEWRWVEQTCRNRLWTSIGGIVSSLRDVTEQVEAEQALRSSELRYRTIAETAQEGIWAVSESGRTVFGNARMAAILGISTAELARRHASDLFPPDVAEYLAFRLATHAPDAREHVEVRYEHPDGSERRLGISAAPMAIPGDGAGSLAMVSDVTDLRRYERELAAAALHDGLTGLPNRALLTDRLGRAVVRERGGTALLVVSIDRLQLVNQSYGHRAGDLLLTQVAQRLLEAQRPADSVGRLDGRAFGVVCEDTSADQAVQQAGELLAVLARPFEVDGVAVHVTASVGVAVTEADGTPADELLRHADIAQHAAHAAGGNRLQLFDAGLAEQVAQRFSLGTELRAAVEQDALTLRHEPVVDLRTGRVVGVEALVRWDRLERGAVAPDQLRAVAQLTGLAPELDRWVLHRALAEYGRLHAGGHLPADAYLAVDVAAVSVSELALDETLVGWAAHHGVAPRQLVVEVLETDVVEDGRQDASVLRRLQEQGFAIAVADFGAGHGSLSFLRDLPVAALKIDASFVRDVDRDPDALAIVASIVDLARAVGMTAVAEGVDSADQVAVLHRLGCTRAQGRLWSPPLPASEVELSGAWLEPFATGRPPSPPTALRTGPPVDLPVEPEHGLHRLLVLHRDGASLATVAAALNSEGFRTPGGARWHRTSVARVVADEAYPSLTARS